MKRWVRVLCLACAAALSASCRRQEPEESSDFDPKVDPPAGVVRTTLDPAIADDQVRISGQIKVYTPPKEPAKPAAAPVKAKAAAAPKPAEAAPGEEVLELEDIEIVEEAAAAPAPQPEKPPAK